MGPEHVAELEKKTRETVDSQGWLHSGDKGCRDARGMFRVTGRFKELLIGAGGENVAPVRSPRPPLTRWAHYTPDGPTTTPNGPTTHQMGPTSRRAFL